ncbi:hypothetical protein ABN763_17595 [Spongiivirga sp. MCCC 1A20706]|uniref:hypothetical protein n=1 Tax=Spongiivirga sp. MCCC 1A20706 TaxID=3160963 RepID=UPI003977896D
MYCSILILIVTSCNTDDRDGMTENICALSQIDDGIRILEYKYNITGDLFRINVYPSPLPENTNPAASFFRSQITKDSIIVGVMQNLVTNGRVLISAKYENDLLLEVKRFYASGNTNNFRFEYEGASVTVFLSFTENNTTTNLERGLYTFDTNQNIIAFDRYVFDVNNQEVLLGSIDYEYEPDAFNPRKALLFPTFFEQNLPDASFFSTDSASKKTIGESAINFSIETNENDKVNVITDLTNFETEIYSYLNCNE